MTYPSTLIVEVTEEDIINGVRGDCYRCPIACAVMRIVGEDAVVRVARDSFILDGNRYGLPFDAIWFIKNFDQPAFNGKTPQPIKFEAQRIL